MPKHELHLVVEIRLPPPDQEEAWHRTCSLACRNALPCMNGHDRPRHLQGQGCLICRANRWYWRQRGRSLREDLAWGRAVAPAANLSYDEWVAVLRRVVFWRQQAVKVWLLEPHILEHYAGCDSFGQAITPEEIAGM